MNLMDVTARRAPALACPPRRPRAALGTKPEQGVGVSRGVARLPLPRRAASPGCRARLPRTAVTHVCHARLPRRAVTPRRLGPPARAQGAATADVELESSHGSRHPSRCEEPQGPISLGAWARPAPGSDLAPALPVEGEPSSAAGPGGSSPGSAPRGARRESGSSAAGGAGPEDDWSFLSPVSIPKIPLTTIRGGTPVVRPTAALPSDRSPCMTRRACPLIPLSHSRSLRRARAVERPWLAPAAAAAPARYGRRRRFSPALQPGVSARCFSPAFQPGVSARCFSPAFQPGVSARRFGPAFQPGACSALLSPLKLMRDELSSMACTLPLRAIFGCVCGAPNPPKPT